MARWNVVADVIYTHEFEIDAESREEAQAIAKELIQADPTGAMTEDIWVSAYEIEEDE